jgi:hypothetical protein
VKARIKNKIKKDVGEHLLSVPTSLSSPHDPISDRAKEIKKPQAPNSCAAARKLRTIPLPGGRRTTPFKGTQDSSQELHGAKHFWVKH